MRNKKGRGKAIRRFATTFILKWDGVPSRPPGWAVVIESAWAGAQLEWIMTTGPSAAKMRGVEDLNGCPAAADDTAAGQRARCLMYLARVAQGRRADRLNRGAGCWMCRRRG